jgi:hypothetical protein
MPDQSRPDTPPPPEHFHYFMLRLRSRGSDSPVAGMVEQLSTGEKRDFETADSLVDHLRQWVRARLGRSR